LPRHDCSDFVSQIAKSVSLGRIPIFSFSRGAKFGEFRLTVPAQVACWLLVGARR
jgi:hypothetical protein